MNNSSNKIPYEKPLTRQEIALQKRIDSAIKVKEGALKSAAEADAQIKALLAQKKAVLNRQKTQDAKRLRSEETRKKLLAGACALHDAASDEVARTRFLERLDLYLTRDRDRALFGLAPKATVHTP